MKTEHSKTTTTTTTTTPIEAVQSVVKTIATSI